MDVSWIAAACVLALASGGAEPPAFTARETGRPLAAQREHAARLREALSGLERGIAALRSLERIELARELERVADELRRELAAGELRPEPAERARRPDHPELRVAAAQLEALRLAMPALREEERGDAVEIVARAIHARELALEGHDGPGAAEARREAPGRDEIVKVLVLAGQIYLKRGADERARELGRLTRELWGGHDEGRPRAEPGRDEPRHELEVMETAVHGLREAGRHDAADVLARAVRARAARLEGRPDRAPEPDDGGPDLGAQVELLSMAAAEWKRLGRVDHAEAVGALAKRTQERWQRAAREREGPQPDRLDAMAKRLDRLEAAVQRLQERIEALRP